MSYIFKSREYSAGMGPKDKWFVTCYQIPVFSVEAFDRWADENPMQVVPAGLTRLLRIKTICQMEFVKQ
jgi:hypothetical protein